MEEDRDVVICPEEEMISKHEKELRQMFPISSATEEERLTDSKEVDHILHFSRETEEDFDKRGV